jgi:hypothetical protein
MSSHARVSDLDLCCRGRDGWLKEREDRAVEVLGQGWSRLAVGRKEGGWHGWSCSASDGSGSASEVAQAVAVGWSYTVRDVGGGADMGGVAAAGSGRAESGRCGGFGLARRGAER